jgi:hypothetical protein
LSLINQHGTERLDAAIQEDSEKKFSAATLSPEYGNAKVALDAVTV